MTRRALVIGPGGIGEAVCERLAADGFDLVVADKSPEVADRVATSLGPSHSAAEVDVTDEEAVARLFDNAEARSPVDVVVNLAGLLVGEGPPSIRELPAPDWRLMMDVNAFGAFLITRETLRRRARRPVEHGRLILFSSLAAHVGGARSNAAYAAAKGAVLTLNRSAAREAGPLGMTVNVVTPGLVESAMMRVALPRSADGEAIANIPVGRIGQPEDVAAAVSFLASPQSGYVTGSVLDVNGGQVMR